MFRRIAIKRWRSFDENGVVLDQLGPVTVIVGKNNSGKSNVGRFLRVAQRHFRFLKGKGQGAWANTVCEIKDRDPWLHEGKAITGTFDIDPGWIPVPAPKNYVVDGVVRVELELAPGKEFRFSPVDENTRRLLSFDGGNMQIWNPSQGKYVGDAAAEDRSFVDALVSTLATKILYIDPLRDPFGHHPLDENTATGDEMLKLLHETRSKKDHPHEWRQLHDALVRWLAVILGENLATINLDLHQDDVALSFRRGSASFSTLLRDVGSGVSQVLVLLTFLLHRAKEPHFIVIDEPESNLHASAARELLRVVREELGASHEMLVSTHSTFIVDSLETDWKLFRSEQPEQTGTTRFARVAAVHDENALLRDLGIRPSQLFLANSILWVEGPSDAIYLRRLLREVDPALLEGRDFAFVCYGGALLAALTTGEADAPERVVHLFRASRHPILVADRDVDVGAPLKKHVRRLHALLKAESEGAMFVVNGREIENLVLPEVLASAFNELVPSMRIANRNCKIKLVPAGLDSSARFTQALASSARTRGKLLTPPQREHLVARLVRGKVAAALNITGRPGNIFRGQGQSWCESIAERIRSAT